MPEAEAPAAPITDMSTWTETWKSAEAELAAAEKKKGKPEPVVAAEVAPEAEPKPAKAKPAAKAPPIVEAAPETDDADEPAPKPEDDDKRGKVHPAERAKFREEKRAARVALAQQQDALARERAELAAKASAYDEAEQAWEMGDFETWLQKTKKIGLNDFQKRVVDGLRNRDPRVEQMKARQEELERKLAEKEQGERTARQEADWRAYGERWRGGVSEHLAQAEDPELQKLSKFTPLLQQAFETYGDDDDVSAEEVIAGISTELVPKFRAAYEQLHQIFGTQGAAIPEQSTGETPVSARPGGKPPKTLSQRQAAEVSTESRPQSDKEWAREWASKMERELDARP